MAVRIETSQYEWTHGHKPRQPQGGGAAGWAFRIDFAPQHILLHGKYQDVLTQATAMAVAVVTVLP